MKDRRGGGGGGSFSNENAGAAAVTAKRLSAAVVPNDENREVAYQNQNKQLPLGGAAMVAACPSPATPLSSYPAVKAPLAPIQAPNGNIKPLLSQVNHTAAQSETAMPGPAPGQALGVHSELGREPTPIDVEYPSREELRPLDDPSAALQDLKERLSSSDWACVCTALGEARRLALHHTVAAEPQLDAMVSLCLKSVKSPRSALCKTAILCLGDVFYAFQDRAGPLFGECTLPLLLKASQDKRFVAEAAEAALADAATYMYPSVSVRALLTHAKGSKSPRVRAKAGQAMTLAVQRMSAEELQAYGLDELVQVGGNLLIDQLPEAREAARKLLACLHAAHRYVTALTPSTTPAPSSEVSTPTSETSAPDSMQEENSTSTNAWVAMCHRLLTATTALAVVKVTAGG
eukprot:jgi/Chlat1/3050/Chrsp208S03293